MAQACIDAVMQSIEKQLARKRANKYFRWHVSGEILSPKYFEMVITIAKDFPEWKFWIYTKMYGIVNAYVKAHGGNKETAIPANLSIMFSEWDGMKMDNPYNFGVFAVKLEDGNKNGDPSKRPGYMKCPGNCDFCKAHNCGCVANQNVWTNEH
jgi:frataxin-like iron-binding protein CyaY